MPMTVRITVLMHRDFKHNLLHFAETIQAIMSNHLHSMLTVHGEQSVLCKVLACNTWPQAMLGRALKAMRTILKPPSCSLLQALMDSLDTKQVQREMRVICLSAAHLCTRLPAQMEHMDDLPLLSGHCQLCLRHCGRIGCQATQGPHEIVFKVNLT